MKLHKFYSVFLILIITLTPLLTFLMFPMSQPIPKAEAASGYSAYFGNFWNTSVEGISTFETKNTGYSWRFTARYNGNVSIRFYVEAKSAQSPFVTVGIQADSSGLPTGQWLGANQVNMSVAGFLALIKLNSTVNLVKSVTYHIVTRYYNGTIGASNRLTFKFIDTTNFKQESPDMWTDSNQAWLTTANNGTNWTTTTNRNAVFALDYNSTTYNQAQFANVLIGRDGYGTDRPQGERWKQIQGTMTVNAIRNLWLAKFGSPAGPLWFQIWNFSGTELLSTSNPQLMLNITLLSAVSSLPVYSAYAPYNLSFPTNIVFSNNIIYQFSLVAPNANSSNSFYLLRSNYIHGYADEKVTWQGNLGKGGNGNQTNNLAGSWFSYEDVIFAFVLAPAGVALNIQVQDFGGGAILSGAWIIPNGSLAQMAVTSGWANYTGVSDGTYLIKGKWQNSTVSGNGWVKVNSTDSLTVVISGAAKTILVRFSVYDTTVAFYPVTPASIAITFGHNSSSKTLSSYSFKVANYTNTPTTITWQGSNVRQNTTGFTATSDPQTFSYNLQVYSNYQILSRFNDGSTAFSPTSISLTAPNSTAKTITSYTISYVQNGTWTITRILYWGGNVKPSSNPTFSPTGNSQSTTVNSRIYSTTPAFSDLDSSAVATSQIASYVATFPNSTQKTGLSAGSAYWMQNGTTTIPTVTWQSVNVTHASNTFDATNGSPTVQLRLKAHTARGGGYIGANRTITAMTANSQTETNLTATITGAGGVAYRIPIQVNTNASYIEKDNINVTWTWTPSTLIRIDTTGLSVFEVIWPASAPSSSGGGVRIIGDEVTTTTTGQALLTFIIPSNLATGAALAVIFIVGSALGYIKIKDRIEPDGIWRRKLKKLKGMKHVKWKKKDVEF